TVLKSVQSDRGEGTPTGFLPDAVTETKVCRHGSMTFLRFDEFIGRSLSEYGEWAEQEIELLRRFLEPDAVAIDAGANVGSHVLALAASVGRTGRIYAFEP